MDASNLLQPRQDGIEHLFYFLQNTIYRRQNVVLDLTSCYQNSFGQNCFSTCTKGYSENRLGVIGLLCAREEYVSNFKTDDHETALGNGKR